MKTQVNFKFKVKFYNFFQNSPIIISTCETHIFQKMAVIFFLVNIIKKIFRWDIRHIKLHKFHIEHIFWKCLYFREFWKYPFAYNYFPHCTWRDNRIVEVGLWHDLDHPHTRILLNYFFDHFIVWGPFEWWGYK